MLMGFYKTGIDTTGLRCFMDNSEGDLGRETECFSKWADMFSLEKEMLMLQIISSRMNISQDIHQLFVGRFVFFSKNYLVGSLADISQQPLTERI